MRIGIIGDALDRQYAGIHYYTKNLIKSLVKVDCENEYFLFRTKEDRPLDGIRTIIVPPRLGPMARMVRIFVQIPHLSKKYDLDILIEPAHFGPFNVGSKIKRVTVVHDLSPILFPRLHPWISGLLQRLFLPGILKRVNLVITNSEYTKSDVIKHIGLSSKKIVAAPLGISERFKPTNDQEVLGRYGLYKKYILYQGTIEPRKNLINLIKAYELYRHSYPRSNIQLILSGKEGWKSEGVIRKKFDSFYQDDIILLGYVDRNDMPAIYSSSTLFVYPSLYEGFGLPVLEALACGTKVVTSNSSCLPEVGKKFVKYFDPNDIEGISNIIYQAMNDQVFQEDQLEYTSGYTWDKMAHTIVNSLNQLTH